MSPIKSSGIQLRFCTTLKLSIGIQNCKDFNGLV